MKLYCFYTTSYEVLLKNWFLPSVKEDFEIVLKESRFQGGPINYKRPGWHEITLEKVEKIIEATQENWQKPFIFSDPDIQFFRPTGPTIKKLLADKDIVIQRNGPGSDVACTGFFALKGNAKTLKIWQDVHERMRAENAGEQDSFNFLLKRKSFLDEWMYKFSLKKGYTRITKTGCNPYGIQWDFLPPRFLTGENLTGKIWDPVSPYISPKDIVIHHATCTTGIENKIIQLEYVRDLVQGQKNK